MAGRDLFSKGFPTNRIPVQIPSTGQPVILRETTITELKSIAKTIIDNLDRKQMDVIYDAVTEYLKAMVLTDGVDVENMTEFDRLFCLMVFFQMSFFKEPITHKCPHCGVDIVYRYDMSKYLSKMVESYVEDQTVEIEFKARSYEMVVGWPSVKRMSGMMRYFYNYMGEVTEELERTQFGINFLFSFIKSVKVVNLVNGHVDAEIDMTQIEDWGDVVECLNMIPSMVMFDDEDGVFSKITGYFINRLENCF